MKDPAFKVQLFRFVDVFPMLRDSRQVHEYLTECLSEPGVRLPGWMDLGLKAGGPEYLLNFVQPCCVCENTLRHGFAPGLE